MLLSSDTKCKKTVCLSYNETYRVDVYKKSGRVNNMSFETIYHEKEVGYTYWISRKIMETIFLLRLKSAYFEIRHFNL